MKTKAYVSLLVCFLLILPLCLTACNKTPPTDNADTTLADTTETTMIESTIKITDDYVIIRPDNDSQVLISSIQKVSSAFNEKCGYNLTLTTDWLKPGTTASEKEILLGLTNREESIEAAEDLKPNDFIIKVSGQKIIIVGGSDEATEKATDYFCENYIKEETKLNKTELYKYSVSYPVKNISLDGVDISNYQIVYSLSEQDIYNDAAQKINERLLTLCGITLNIVNTSAEQTSYEILLGNTNRSESNILTISKKIEYGTGIKGAKVVMSAGCVYAANEAVNDLLDNYLNESLNGDIAINLRDYSLISEVAYMTDLTLMSNNVLADSTAKDRTDLLYDTYMNYSPDIIGLQECSSTHYTNIVAKLIIAGYKATCTTIDNKDNAMSYTPILYSGDKYTLVDKGCFLYDQRYMETNTKTLSYAVFIDNDTRQKFAVINTHFAIITSSYPASVGTNSVEGAAWREDNARQVKETYLSILQKHGDIPVFAMGDFNCTSSSTAYSSLTETLDDTQDMAIIYNTDGTGSWHNVGVLPTVGGDPIDHIFVSEDDVEVYTYEIPLDQDVLNSTDHCPVIIEIRFK